MQRERHAATPNNLDSHRLPEFLNPFSYMSSDEARVTLELYRRNVPFTYRYFDGVAPTVQKLIPDFAPEFTLSEYKTVIMVEGGFWSTATGVLDQSALAKVLLEHDGWKVIILFEQDILHNLTDVLDQQFPESVHPLITGGEKPSPFAPPHWMFTRRQFLRGLALLRKNFNPKEVVTSVSAIRSRRRRGGVVSDVGRTRTLRAHRRKVVE